MSFNHAFVLLAVCLALPVFGQPCDDWATTLPAPTHFPTLTGMDLLTVGDLLVVLGSQLRVCEWVDGEPIVVGNCETPSNRRRLRLVDGEVYLASGNSGLWRVDLADPYRPYCEPVLVEIGDVQDVTGFDGGLFVATRTSFFVLDSAGALVASADLAGFDGSVAAVASSGTTVLLNRYGKLQTIDLSAPQTPIIGNGLQCDPEHYYGDRLTGDIIVIGDRVYLTYSWDIWETGFHEDYLQCADISDPLNPEVLACRNLPSKALRLASTEGLLVVPTLNSVTFHGLDDLNPAAGVMVPEDLSNGVGLAIWHGRTVVVRDADGMWLLEVAPLDVIAPLVEHEVGYNAYAGGRFALAWWSRGGHFAEGEYHWTVFDQLDPTAPIAIEVGGGPLPVGVSRGQSIIAQQSNWAIVHSATNHSDEHDSWSIQSISAVNLAGERFLLGSASCDAVCSLGDDRVWVLLCDTWGDNRIKAYDLLGDEPSLLADVDTEEMGQLFARGDLLLVIRDNDIAIYDVSDPSAIEIVDVVDSGRLNPSPEILSDGDVILVPSQDGATAFSFTSDPTRPLAERGHVILPRSPSGWVKFGDLVAFSTRYEWGIFSIADLDAPAVLFLEPGFSATGFHWHDDHLYVGGYGSVYLFDVTDPSAPVWLGQSMPGGHTEGSLGARGDLLLDGYRVLPLDCGDQETGVAEDQHDQAPSFSVLLERPTPNPFNPRTSIGFDLSQLDDVRITVHDLRGRRVAILADARFPGGHHTLTWNGVDQRGRSLPSGTYLVRLQTDTVVRTTKAVLIR
ncbi:MAG: T9SS type A sorting domain-containing protein [Candidatus Krumholzibacteriia bacterium]